MRSHTLIKRAETQREASSLFCFVIGSCLRLVGDILQIQRIRHPLDTLNYYRDRLNIVIGSSLLDLTVNQKAASHTRVKISQAISGLLAQQLCNNSVNMIEQDW